MLWALQDRDRVQATPGARAICPQCSGDVLAKCGDIITWHWAHIANDCDMWNEPESDWHHRWKSYFPSSWQEVTIGAHRADICTPSWIIELQASPLSPEEIIEREHHYQKMVWLLRAEDFIKGFDLRFDAKRSITTFRWKWPRKSWWYATTPIILDIPRHVKTVAITGPNIKQQRWNGGLFLIKKLHQHIPCGGWGIWVDRQGFFSGDPRNLRPIQPHIETCLIPRNLREGFSHARHLP